MQNQLNILNETFLLQSLQEIEKQLKHVVIKMEHDEKTMVPHCKQKEAQSSVSDRWTSSNAPLTLEDHAKLA